MNTDTQPSRRRENVISSLGIATYVPDIAKETLSIGPARAVFSSVGVLSMIKARFPLSDFANSLPVYAYPGFNS